MTAIYEKNVAAKMALTGAPFLFNFKNALGASPFSAKENTMRDVA